MPRMDLSRRQVLQAVRAAAVLTASGALLAACGKKAPKAAAVPTGATVLALGDSLTQGVGASAETAYPHVLAERTGWKVVNAGVSGETSRQIADRLPGLLDEHQPALVILCAGGNDWLQRKSEQDVQTEISRMLQLCKARAVPVLLVAVPELSLSAALTGRMKDHSIYQTLAKDSKVSLLSGAWSEVLGNSAMRADQVHANAAGYARFAELLETQLRASGFLAG